MWNLPEPAKKLLRKYAPVVCSLEHPYPARLKVFYEILSPMLGWVKSKLTELGVPERDIETEIFFLSDNLLKGFDPRKSSIIPYLRKQVPWQVGALVRKLNRFKYEVPLGLLNGSPVLRNRSYTMPEEVWLSVPKLLFIDKWLPKNLQRSEKYLIYRLLSSFEGKTNRVTVNDGGTERKTMSKRIAQLRDILKKAGLHD